MSRRLLLLCVCAVLAASCRGSAPAPQAETAPASWRQEALGHLSGASGKVDKARALAVYETACAARNGEACREAAVLLVEAPKAEARYQAGCDAGDGDSCRELVALLRTTNRDAAKADALHARAIELYTKACTGGDANACLGLGRMYGGFAPPDEAKAAMWNEKGTAILKPACERGEAPACRRLGRAYLEGTGVPSDFGQAVALSARACTLGDAPGCAEAASLYKTTDTTDDDAQAPPLFEKACLAGVFERQPCREAGFLYVDGEGVPADKPRGVGLLERACALGDVSSCLMAGALLRDGEGVPADPAKAAELTRILDGLEVKVTSVKRAKTAPDPMAYQVGVPASEMPPITAPAGHELVVVGFSVRRIRSESSLPVRAVWVVDAKGARHPDTLKNDLTWGQSDTFERELVFVVPAGFRPVKVKFELGGLTLDLPPARG